MSKDLIRRVRQLVAVFVIGWFGTQLVAVVLRTLLTGGARPVYIDPWLFLLLVFGTSLSVAGLVIGAAAIVILAIRRRPRRKVIRGSRGERQIQIIGSDGRPL